MGPAPELDLFEVRFLAMPHEPSSTTARTTIMVVERDILVRMVVSDYLRECGYKVIEGVTADDVLTVLKSGGKIDVLFVEVQLDGSMDGFSLAQWTRQNHAAIDVILASGVSKTAKEAAQLCEDGPVEKPYNPREVARRINILLQRRRAASKR
jgi:DNA-binding response OmpR family regulator